MSLNAGLSNPAGCRKPDDVARMNSMGFTGVLIDLDSLKAWIVPPMK
ncbi:hypothetical protein JRY29_19705 [Salmonella enterica subsp. enterica serovar Kentucky]|nr:hypothetical protein JRY29_19705 [Salmonella enterica subsp. enterica serovar Kentucky]